jgi:hypothetical protein
VKSKQIEEISETGKDGRILKKYALKEEDRGRAIAVPVWSFLDFVPTRRLLELAAWMKREPKGWPDNDEVKKAKLLKSHFLVPRIEVPREDPDSYAFVWPKESCDIPASSELVHSRFFNFKHVYDAVIRESEVSSTSVSGNVYVGAYGSNVMVDQVTTYKDIARQLNEFRIPSEFSIVEGPYSVCVAVRREPDDFLRVVHVEGREGKFDKTWVKSLCKLLKAKKERTISYDSLKEDLKRKLLLRLREILDQHHLFIPHRYSKLIEEILDYNYRNPSTGYVLALSIAVCSCHR